MSSDQSRPNLIFLFADQWRRQAVGNMNQDPVRTPRMDQFASEGATFTQACTCSPICTPSRASIISGKHPFSVGMTHNWLQFPPEEESIGKAFARGGYDTGYIGKWHLDSFQDGDIANIWNIFTPPGERRQGFDFWYAHGCNHKHFRCSYMTTSGKLVEQEDCWQLGHETDVAIDYLSNRPVAGEGPPRDTAKPFCLFLAWSPPHTTNPYPYVPENKSQPLKGLVNYAGAAPAYHYQAPAKFEERYREEGIPVRENARQFAEEYRTNAPGYFGAVESMDDEFGRLLDALEQLGLADNTIVALSSDHGDMLGSHGMFTKDVWYEESIGIPFMIRWPQTIPAGERPDQLISTVDFMPTFLGLAGLQPAVPRQGKDLSGVMKGEQQEVDNPIFLSHDCGSPFGKVDVEGYPEEKGRFWRGVRTGRYTYVIVDSSPDSQYHDPERFMRPLPAGMHSVLYDLEADPFQMHPIYAGDDPETDTIIVDLHRQVEEWLGAMGDPFPMPQPGMSSERIPTGGPGRA